MYEGKNVAVIVPAYNEANQIGKVIEAMPDYVDAIVVIDDMSKDKTAEIVNKSRLNNGKIRLIQHTKNQGVGGVIATGYK